MPGLNLDDIINYVESNIGTFHQKRIDSLGSLKLRQVLKKKNPYLFKAKNVLTAGEIIKAIIDAYLSSQEETIFGDWLEGLAIFVNNRVYMGWKSGITGIDLEFDKDGTRYIVTIKSGPNWGNSNAVNKMVIDFNKAKKTLRTSSSKLNIVAVNGCCYGRDNNPDKGYYFKYCGQKFWEFISGDPDLYTELIKPLGYRAKERNEIFTEQYSRMINKFTMEFGKEFCNQKGAIDWEKIVKFNSSIAPPPRKIKSKKNDSN